MSDNDENFPSEQDRSSEESEYTVDEQNTFISHFSDLVFTIEYLLEYKALLKRKMELYSCGNQEQYLEEIEAIELRECILKNLCRHFMRKVQRRL
jgi:hypothetical protein